MRRTEPASTSEPASRSEAASNWPPEAPPSYDTASRDALLGGTSSNMVATGPSPTPDQQPTGSDGGASNRSSVPTRAWVAIVTLAIVTAIFAGLYFTKDSSPSQSGPQSSTANNESGENETPAASPATQSALDDESPSATAGSAPGDQAAGPATAVAPTSGRIPSGTYALPGGINPGVYRVGTGWQTFDSEGEFVDNSEVYDGPTLLVVPENATPGTVQVEGGLVKADEGPIDPFQYRDGTYLVGYDIEPGTYRVTVATTPVDSLLLKRLDQDLKTLDSELSLYPESGESLTIEVLATDYAFQFEGVLEKVG